MPRSHTTPKRMGKYHITAILRLADGSERVEDLGVVEGVRGEKARDRAVTLHAGRLGIRRRKRGGGWTGKWTFKIKHVPTIADQEEQSSG